MPVMMVLEMSCRRCKIERKSYCLFQQGPFEASKKLLRYTPWAADCREDYEIFPHPYFACELASLFP